jgi:hypothetical protein
VGGAKMEAVAMMEANKATFTKLEKRYADCS